MTTSGNRSTQHAARTPEHLFAPSAPAGYHTQAPRKALSAATSRLGEPCPQAVPMPGRPTTLESRRRERIFAITLARTGSVDLAMRESKVKPARVGELLDRPDVRSILLASDTVAA